MTPLLSRSTLALAQRNAATGLVVSRQGAEALQRRSLVEARRTRVRVAAERQSHCAANSDSMAFKEHKIEDGSRTGDSDGGVGR